MSLRSAMSGGKTYKVVNLKDIRVNEKKFYESELARLNEEEDYLKVESEKLQDPDYIARYAREQYLYSKDGEFNIRIN